MVKKALITGITGQDGSYLAEFLLDKGYEVHGIIRRSSSFNTGRIEHLYFEDYIEDMHKKKRINLYYGDMTDTTSLLSLVQGIQPDEIYNLAAQSHVKVSFETPEYTANSDALGTLRLLEIIRLLGLGKRDSFLPGLNLRAIRTCAGGSSAGEHTVLSPQPIRRCQALCILDSGQLPRSIRSICRQRHSLQPRIRKEGRNLRN